MSTVRLLTRLTGGCAFNNGLSQKQQRLRQHAYQRCWRPTALLATSYAIPEQNEQPSRHYYCMHSTNNDNDLRHARKNSLLMAQLTAAMNSLHLHTFSTDSKPNRSEKSGNKPPTPTVSESEIFGEASKLGIFAKFKLMYTKYWYVTVPVHFVTSLGWFGGFYYMSKSGVDIVSLMQYIHLSESIMEKVHSSDMGHLAVAYLCYKVATPLRYAVTLGGTTLTIKYLVQAGHIKPIPSKQDIIKMYEQKKADLIAKSDKVKGTEKVFETSKITTKQAPAVTTSNTPSPPPTSAVPKAEQFKSHQRK